MENCVGMFMRFIMLIAKLSPWILIATLHLDEAISEDSETSGVNRLIHDRYNSEEKI